jgi:anti-sigma B factor antagonist
VTVQPLPDRGDGVRLLCAHGELDAVVAPSLLPDVPSLVASARGVVLDLSDVTFFDSSGVRLVDRLARECGRLEAPFQVVAPPGSACRRVLELVGMAADLARDDLTAAIEAVQPAP